uniref:Uncharacterized protein n=1 Tax=Rhizophora mucronata TaxID=61149 RepID=A0A2P2Q8R1_RHIMU
MRSPFLLSQIIPSKVALTFKNEIIKKSLKFSKWEHGCENW